MADRKTSALNAITAAEAAIGDYFPWADISANELKKLAASAAYDAILRTSRSIVVIADAFDGSDAGAKINAAMAAAPANSEVWLFTGNIATTCTVTSDHVLRLLGDITVSAASFVNGVGATVGPVTLQSRTALCGAGPFGAGISSIQESSHATTYALIQADGMLTANFASANTDIHVYDLEIRGYPGHADDPGGQAAVGLGNTTRGSVRRCWFNGPLHQLHCGCGGGPSSGNHAEDCWFEGNYFTDGRICLWTVNGKNIHFVDNTFRRCITPIDLEPNDSRDVIEHIHVCGNFMDFRGAAVGSQAVAIQDSFINRTGPFKINGNTVIGADLDSGASTTLVWGINVVGAGNGEIGHNVIQRAYGGGINFTSDAAGGRWHIHDNDLFACGDGSNPGFLVRGVNHRIVNNRLIHVAGIASDCRIVEANWSATVNTNGTAVTTAGGPFAEWMAGMSVLVNGVANVIDTTGTGGTGVAGQGCTLAYSAGVQTGVTMTFLTTDNHYLDNGGAPVVPLANSRAVVVDREAPHSSWGVTAHWKLQEASGTRVDSASTNDLTDNNTVTRAAGKVGHAAQFVTANSEYLSITDNAAMSMGSDTAFWFALWFNPSSIAAVRYLLGKWGAAGTGAVVEYYINLQDNATQDFLDFVVGNGSTLGTASTFGGTKTPVVGTWMFVLCWHDPVNNTVNIRLDDAAAISSVWAGGTQNGASSFTLGRPGDVAGFYYDGLLGPVSFGKPMRPIASVIDDIHAWYWNNGGGWAWAYD